MKKQELREIYKARRNSLTAEQLTLLDEQLLEQLQQYDWSAVRYLHLYLSIEKFKEFNTWPFIKWIWQQYPEITLVTSKSDFETHQLHHYRLEKDGKLLSNSWGIPEPIDAEEVAVELIDAVLTPLLVVDQHGNRVGYGKGFYDRFLANCRPNVLKFGISYFEPVPLIEDVNEWDVAISRLFTPGKTFYLEG